MVQLSTPVIALHTAPLVVKTFFNHLGHKKKDRKKNGRQRAASEGKAGIAACSANPGVKSELEGLTETPEDEYESPESQLSYDEGLQIVKRFLQVAKDHTVEELQAFTAMHVPSPKWIHLTHVAIPESSIILSAEIITNHFKTFYGPNGLKEIGGGSWWQVRGRELEGEWIEMKKDYLKRTKRKVEEAKGVVWDDDPSEPGKADRVILYIHGGAYFFSSLDTHRYQIQRHARKLGGRAFAPSYRLAPQYPFPCGLHDALASYLFLLNPPEGSSQPAIPASSIILSGDSAGAGLVLSLLCIIRDSGGTVPMPAGASLISPWVDLTHSFKSIMGDDSGDYIPSEGFHYKPSFAWPPIRGNGITIEMKNEDGSFSSKTLDEQVQMYANNKLLSHPLVSPVNQGSLGGLCPLLILGGSSELLRDEMIYIAHKAAAPETYPPSSHVLERYPGQKEMVSHFPPTKVHLQMYDGCAHVTPTLSFTRPAKWMYRACANFNIWAITAAQLSEQRRLDHKLSHQYGHPYHNQQHQHQHQHQHYHSQPQQSFANDSSVDPSSVNSPSSGLSRSETLDASYAPSSNTSVESVMNADPSQPTIAKHITASVHELANEVDVVSDAGSECDSSDSEYCAANEKGLVEAGEVVIVSGREPLFVDSMVRERVSIRGRIRPFELVEKCDTFVNLDRDEVGKIHGDGPIAKWLQAREAHDKKFAKELAKYRTYKIQDRRAASQSGYITRDLPDTPPLSALAGWHDRETARKTAKSVDEVGRRGKSASGMLSVWMRASQKDEESRAHKDQVSSLEKELQELGVHGSEIDVLGDKKLKDVSRHLKKHAVIVVENPPRDESTFNPDKGRLVESKVEAKPAVKQVEAGSASGSPLSPNDRQKNKPSN